VQFGGLLLVVVDIQLVSLRPDLCRDSGVWVPNWPSAVVTCDGAELNEHDDATFRSLPGGSCANTHTRPPCRRFASRETPTDLLPHNYRGPSMITFGYYEKRQHSTAPDQAPTYQGSAIPAVVACQLRWYPHRSRLFRGNPVRLACHGEVSTHVTCRAKRKNISILIFLAQAYNVHRAGVHPSPATYPILLRDSSAFRKKLDSCVEKATVFRSSGLSSHAPLVPPTPCGETSMTDANHTAPARRSAHRVSAPARPSHHLGGADSGQPGMRTHRHQVPRLASFAGAWPVRSYATNSAVQLRNTATRPTNTVPQRPPLAGELRK
jgi:hypothetical protein